MKADDEIFHIFIVDLLRVEYTQTVMIFDCLETCFDMRKRERERERERDLGFVLTLLYFFRSPRFFCIFIDYVDFILRFVKSHACPRASRFHARFAIESHFIIYRFA